MAENASKGFRRRRLSPQQRAGIFMILPLLVIVGSFTIYPFGYAFYLSFTKYKIYEPQNIGKFNGFNNYASVVKGTYFLEALTNTLLFTVLSVVVIIGIAIGVSVALNERFRGAGLVRFLILIPWAIPPAAAGLMWRWVFHSFGWINKIGAAAGLLQEPIYFLSTNRITQVGLAVTAQLWQQLPFCVILLMATLQLIPTEILDQAKVDGATGWKRFRTIILPYMKTALAIVSAYQALLALTVYDIVYTFTGGTWGLISYYGFAESFQWGNLGNGAALSILLAVATLVVIGIILKVLPAEKWYRYTFAGE